MTTVLWADFVAHGTLHQSMTSEEGLQWFLQQALVQRLLTNLSISHEDVEAWYVCRGDTVPHAACSYRCCLPLYRWMLTESPLPSPKFVGFEWFTQQISNTHSKHVGAHVVSPPCAACLVMVLPMPTLVCAVGATVEAGAAGGWAAVHGRACAGPKCV